MAKNRNQNFRVSVRDEILLGSRLPIESYGLYCHLRTLAFETNQNGLILNPDGSPCSQKSIAKIARLKPARFARTFNDLFERWLLVTPNEWLHRIERDEREKFVAIARELVDSAPGKDLPILLRPVIEKRVERIILGAPGKISTDIEGRGPSQRRASRISTARERGTHTEEQWRNLCELFEFRCVRCLVHADDLTGRRLTKDHVQPVSDGGSDAIQNIQPLCRHCNSIKGSKEHRDWRIGFHDRLADFLGRVRG